MKQLLMVLAGSAVVWLGGFARASLTAADRPEAGDKTMLLAQIQMTIIADAAIHSATF